MFWKTLISGYLIITLITSGLIIADYSSCNYHSNNVIEQGFLIIGGGIAWPLTLTGMISNPPDGDQDPFCLNQSLRYG